MNLLGISRPFLLERGLLGGSLHGSLAAAAPTRAANSEKHARHADSNMIPVGSFAHAANGFAPVVILWDRDTGARAIDSLGRTVREATHSGLGGLGGWRGVHVPDRADVAGVGEFRRQQHPWRMLKLNPYWLTGPQALVPPNHDRVTVR